MNHLSQIRTLAATPEKTPQRLAWFLLFVLGVAAPLTALLIYHLLTPRYPPVNSNDVSTAVNQVLASATRLLLSRKPYMQLSSPPRADPIQTSGTDGKSDDSLGTGTIVDANGISSQPACGCQRTSIQVTFADGTSSSASIATQQPANDIAVLKATSCLGRLSGRLGNPNAMRVGDEAYVVGNPYGLYSSMSAGVISGSTGLFNLSIPI